jgi:hypothetical protein
MPTLDVAKILEKIGKEYPLTLENQKETREQESIFEKLKSLGNQITGFSIAWRNTIQNYETNPLDFHTEVSKTYTNIFSMELYVPQTHLYTKFFSNPIGCFNELNSSNKSNQTFWCVLTFLSVEKELSASKIFFDSLPIVLEYFKRPGSNIDKAKSFKENDFIKKKVLPLLEIF